MRAAWPSLRGIACVTRKRDHVRAGRIMKTEVETTYLITSLDAPRPETLLRLNRAHWQIEIMHRDKDVCLGEDGYTNRKDHAPRNIFTLLSAARTVLKRINTSPTKAIEIVQNDRNKALKILTQNSKGAVL
jgi:predicted transposase YbfD/YdcC